MGEKVVEREGNSASDSDLHLSTSEQPHRHRSKATFTHSHLCTQKHKLGSCIYKQPDLWRDRLLLVYSLLYIYTHTYCVGLSVHIHGLTHNVHTTYTGGHTDTPSNTCTCAHCLFITKAHITMTPRLDGYPRVAQNHEPQPMCIYTHAHAHTPALLLRAPKHSASCSGQRSGPTS